MENIEESLRKNFRIHLEESRIPQRDFAKMIGVTPTSIQRWLTGENIMRADHLYRASKALGKSLNSFFGEEDEISPVQALEILSKAISSKPHSPSKIPSDILQAIENADEIDLRSIRNILELPIPDSKRQAN